MNVLGTVFPTNASEREVGTAVSEVRGEKYKHIVHSALPRGV